MNQVYRAQCCFVRCGNENNQRLRDKNAEQHSDDHFGENPACSNRTDLKAEEGWDGSGAEDYDEADNPTQGYATGN